MQERTPDELINAVSDEIVAGYADEIKQWERAGRNTGKKYLAGSLSALLLIAAGAMISNDLPERAFLAAVTALAIGVVGWRAYSRIPNLELEKSKVARMQLHFQHLPTRGGSLWTSRERVWPVQPITEQSIGDNFGWDDFVQRLEQLGAALPRVLDHSVYYNHSLQDQAVRQNTQDTLQLFGVEARIAELLTEIQRRCLESKGTETSCALVPAGLHPLLVAQATSYNPFGSASGVERGAEGERLGNVAGHPVQLLLDQVRSLLTRLDESRSDSAEYLRRHVQSVSEPTHAASMDFLCRACNEGFLSAIARKEFYFGDRVQVPSINRSARMWWRPSERLWECGSCGAKGGDYLAIPRLLTEAIYPAFSTLLEQHHTERQQIYADVDNQKRHYKNEAEKELFQRRDAHKRDSRPLIAKVNELESQAEATSTKLAAFGALMASWEILEQDRLKSINDETREIKQSIQQSQKAFEKHFRARNDAILQSALGSMQRHARLAQRETAAQFALMQSIAVSSERTALASETTAAVQQAWARERGMLKPAAWNLLGNAEYLVEGIGHAISGKSAVGNYLPKSR